MIGEVEVKYVKLLIHSIKVALIDAKLIDVKFTVIDVKRQLQAVN